MKLTNPKSNWLGAILLGLVLGGGTPVQAAVSNITIRAENMSLTGFADPGFGDSGGTNAAGFYLTDADTGTPGSNEVILASLGNDPQTARGGVYFTVTNALPDGIFKISMLLQTHRFGQLNRQFNYLIETIGGGLYNGVANGSSGWIAVTPPNNDAAGSPWEDLILEGGATPGFTYSPPQTSEINLSGIDGVTGQVRIRVLDPWSASYQYLGVESFTFTIPEPSAVMLIGMGLSLLALRRRR